MWTVFAQASVLELVGLEISIITCVIFALFSLLAFTPIGRFFPRYEPVTAKQIVLFAFGCIVLYLSFGGPLDYLSDNYLFSVHMVQHMVEILFMTPLFIYGTPFWMIEPILRVKSLAWLFRHWAHPVTASIVFNVILEVFHIPAIYDLALNSDSFHLFEHACFFIVAIFLWVARSRLTQGRQILFLLLNYNLMMPLVIFMIIAGHPWYTFYVHQPRIYPWLTPIGDQQIGAVVMAVMMMGVYFYLGARAYARQDESTWYA